MFAVISPAKKLNFETESPIDKFTFVRYKEKSQKLIDGLRKCSHKEISKLMKLSESLTELNVERYKNYEPDFDLDNSKQALFAFNGDTYIGLDAGTLKKSDIEYSQKHLGILSGLYGLVSPLDLIQPYRLEMGTRFPCEGAKNLYEFWGETITNELNKILKKEKILLNLSSNEYFSVVKTGKIEGRIITPIFKEKKADGYKVVGFCAKRARGMMSRFMIENRIKDPEDLKSFTMADYKYSSKMSSEDEMVFIRG